MRVMTTGIESYSTLYPHLSLNPLPPQREVQQILGACPACRISPPRPITSEPASLDLVCTLEYDKPSMNTAKWAKWGIIIYWHLRNIRRTEDGSSGRKGEELGTEERKSVREAGRSGLGWAIRTYITSTGWATGCHYYWLTALGSDMRGFSRLPRFQKSHDACASTTEHPSRVWGSLLN